MTPSEPRTLIVDRIEDGFAVLEAGDASLEVGSMHVPASWLPTDAREGSVLRVEVGREGDSSRVALTLDPETQAAREAEIRALRESIPEGPDGDIDL